MRTALWMGLTVLAAVPVAASGQATSERLATATPVAGVVYEDRNGDGQRQSGEPGVSGVAVSDQVQVVLTDASGRFVLDARGYGLVFLSPPDGYLAAGLSWRAASVKARVTTGPPNRS